MAGRAAAAPAALAARIKQTLRTMEEVPAHEAAVEVELDAQLWSMEQPEFAERLAALQSRISGKG
jgi:enoyl-CoA hydratase